MATTCTGMQRDFSRMTGITKRLLLPDASDRGLLIWMWRKQNLFRQFLSLLRLYCSLCYVRTSFVRFFSYYFYFVVFVFLGILVIWLCVYTLLHAGFLSYDRSQRPLNSYCCQMRATVAFWFECGANMTSFVKFFSYYIYFALFVYLLYGYVCTRC